MNIDRALVNRALLKAGQTPLTEDDITNNSEAWKTVKEFYLSTMLETLSRTQWTSAKRRKKLQPVEDTENLSPYSGMFYLPIDCARAVKLNSLMPFIVEGDFMYTDDPSPILMYITNGKLAETEDKPNENQNETETEPQATNEEPVVIEDDIPGYETLTYDPNFWEYIETRLASKIVLKITGDTQLYNLLFSEAMVIEDTAAKASKASGKSKPNGQVYWTDSVVGRM